MLYDFNYKQNLKNKENRTHRYREEIGALQRRGWVWVGEMGESGSKVPTSSYKISPENAVYKMMTR